MVVTGEQDGEQDGEHGGEHDGEHGGEHVENGEHDGGEHDEHNGEYGEHGEPGLDGGHHLGEQVVAGDANTAEETHLGRLAISNPQSVISNQQSADLVQSAPASLGQCSRVSTRNQLASAHPDKAESAAEAGKVSWAFGSQTY